MKNSYKILKDSVKAITEYYQLLVEETKSQRLVGSTNEWVLDNYYMISEQEKELKSDLSGKEFRKLGKVRRGQLVDMLRYYLEKNHFHVDKGLLFRSMNLAQVRTKDYLNYPEVCALLPLLKLILINELALLCGELKAKGAHHYSVTDKSGADPERLSETARENQLMMNIFNSLKRMTKVPVSELIDSVSYSDRMLKEEKAGMYDRMYDRTKDDYRAQIVRLAKKRKMKEFDLVKELVAEADRKGEHVGWQIFKPKKYKQRAHLYIWIISLGAMALAFALALAFTGWSWVTALAALLLLVPMSQIAIDVVNQVLYRLHKPVNTFKIKFKDGLIPEEYATMVIMPTILKNKQKTEEMLDQLEVYYLSNINRASEGQRLDRKHQNLYYTLIGDAAAAQEADMPWDEEVVEAGLAKVKALNEKYGAPIFNFVYRKRAWSEGEECWLGEERKRGAILHFNDLLLGETSEADRQKRFRCETISQWREQAVPDITFVITLDTDTELVLYSAQKLIGAMAHPLNRARLSQDGRRVDAGYGIMQPRVNVDVEVTNKSRYAQLFAGLGGLDVYTTASFELYQDIFNEGTFCGKGIYDLRIFQQVLKGTFPKNLILSHDLIEGCHIRCGLINDVELFDDNPSNYLDDAKRYHRWTRGDWQIIGWLRGRVRNERGDRVKNQVNAIGRWKIFDNLRRSVLSLALLALLLFGYAQPFWNTSAANPSWFVLAVLVVVACPILFFILSQITRLPRFQKQYRYYMTLLRGARVVLIRSFIQFSLLPKEAWMYTDAIIRSCHRMLFSHKQLLAWVPSDEAAKSTKGTVDDYAKKFWFNYVCAVVLVGMSVLLVMCNDLSLAAELALLGAAGFTAFAWVRAPFMMYNLGRKLPQEKRSLSEQETAEVRQWAKDTWHYFDSLITEEHNWLIPDNFQLNRETKADYKTSPTNIGYSLTATISAAELGLISHEQAVERIEHIISTVEKLEKWNGHLFNWYNIHTLAKLPNYFVSTCDSGNFVACLYVVKGYLQIRINDKTIGYKNRLCVGNSGSIRGSFLHAPSMDRACSVLERVSTLITETDFSKLFNPELAVFSIGYDWGASCLLPYHYNNFASEARLTSFLTIAQGDAPYKHWFCLDKTLVQYKGYKGVASWYGTLFEYFMPLIFLPTYRHTLMDETYNFALRAQRAFIRNVEHEHHLKGRLPWGISETAYDELDDAQNYKYHAFGVPYLKFQNTTPDRIVISPYSSLMAIGINDRAVFDNMARFKALNMYDEMGFFESYDDENHTPVRAHYAHHQGMILASLTNYLAGGCLQQYFMQEPVMRSMETLLKEKAQVKPYIDLKVTQYKRYQYSKVQTESDAREQDGIAPMPEIGVLSNGQYTVMLNDRGSGFSRFRNINLNRYRHITASPYGAFLFIRNLQNDSLWCNTYAPLDVMPERYHVTFASDKITYQRSDGGIDTKTEVTVVKDRHAEIRRYTFTNTTGRDVDLELTTYSEAILAHHADDEAHRVFNAMRVSTEYDAEHEMLLLSRGAQRPIDGRNYVMHKLFVPDNGEDRPRVAPEYETSRLKFLGRNGSLRHAEIIDSRRTLTGTVGTTLDPIMSMRRRVRVEAGKSTEVVLIMAFGKAKEQLFEIADLYQGSVDIEHAFETATVFNNMRTSMSLLKGQHMRLYNRMAKFFLQSATHDSRDSLLQSNTLGQPGLWKYGISGDQPILLMEIDSIDRSGYAKEMLRAMEYYKVRGLVPDLVFINNENDENREPLTHFIRNIANTEHLWGSVEHAGRAFILNGCEMSEADLTLLRTVAALSFNTRDGLTLEQQLDRMEADNMRYQEMDDLLVRKPIVDFRVWSALDFYNQYGGFSRDGRDYVVTNTNTPMPWINVLANEQHFGCIVSSTMAGFSFAHNAQQFKLTAWSNDFVRDTHSEMFLIDGQIFVPATARHGQGFSSFDAEYDDYKVMIRLFVSVEKCEKYYQVRVENKTDKPLTLSMDMLYKLVLGDTEEKTARFLHSQWDEASNSLVVRNVYHQLLGHTRLQLTATEKLTHIDSKSLNRKRIGLDIEVPASGRKDFAYVMATYDDMEAPLAQFTYEYVASQFDGVVRYWDERLSHIQVATPDRSLNYMLNRWYLYQVYTARLFARAGFYQVGGATGFRDQLQDVMSCLYSDPAYARKQILDHAAHQFAEGDVLHWWHEAMRFGSRTTFSDDYLWLIFVTYQYITVTGDRSILAEQVCFCQADQLAEGEAERGMNFRVPEHKTALSEGEKDPAFAYATLYEHLRRAMNRSMSRIGRHGLPLMGCGDWNDGMNRVGDQGKGESVWVAFFLVDLLPKLEQLTHMMPGADLSYCSELSTFRERMIKTLRTEAWDGSWYLRAYFDNGEAMGSINNQECQIDLISQAWSILTDVATEEQKQSVFREADARLVNREHEIIQLLTPAFAHSQNDPGYIMRYPEGVRENGGQYTHGAMWYIMAQLKEGRKDIAYYLYSLINPIHRTTTLADVLKYKVEPYCIAADIYSNPQHPGRGGWTWYTGSASWAYKTGIESILGLHKRGNKLIFNPRVPTEWESFTVDYRHGSSTYHLHYKKGMQLPVELDLVDDGKEHEV